jgi:outer membrane lipopolysaccharide assembly protein LptE/RlpB
MARIFTLLTAVLALVPGCGLYTFSGNTLPSRIKTIAIPIFANDSHDPNIGNQVTDAITQRFLTDNRLKVVGEKRADAVLDGKITSYENKVNNYSAGSTPEDYIVVIRVAATLRDAGKNKDLWKEDQFTVTAIYSVTGKSTQLLTTEDDARKKAISDLAEDMLARTFEQW